MGEATSYNYLLSECHRLVGQPACQQPRTHKSVSFWKERKKMTDKQQQQQQQHRQPWAWAWARVRIHTSACVSAHLGFMVAFEESQIDPNPPLSSELNRLDYCLQ